MTVLRSRPKAQLKLETPDMQRLLLSGYGYQPWASYRLLSIDDPAVARRWLAERLDADDVTFDVERTKPDPGKAGLGLNLAFTWRGLARLGLGEEGLASFPRPFRQGMVTEHRSRRLGDANTADWEWGVPDRNEVDVLLMLFAEDEDTLKGAWPPLKAPLKTVGDRKAEKAWLPGKHEGPFGFADGISQPMIKGNPSAQQRKQEREASERELRQSLVQPGEIVLGYPDELGRVAAGPVVPDGRDPERLLDRRSDGRGDLGRNGSYLVVRQFDLHKQAFEDFFRDDPALAAKLMGRFPDGAPLGNPTASEPGRRNDFGFHDDDRDGLVCPIGAHVRRSNPRDSLDPKRPGKALQAANRHRILRRGRLVPDERGEGLFFICLNSDIERQFEFVQREWINEPAFGGLHGERDPVIGLDGGIEPRCPARFSVPGDPVRRRVPDLMQFATVTGGGYFFLPGKQALRYLAGL